MIINAYEPGSFKKVKNKSKIPSGTAAIQVLMKNKKTSVIQRAYLYIE